MTKSFQSYAELKKQAEKDDLEDSHDIEAGKLDKPTEDHNHLSQFFQEVEAIKARIIKSRLEVIDQSNITNRTLSESYIEVTQIRMSVTNGLRAKLRVMLMHGFQSLRDKFLMEKMISRSLKVEFMVAAAGKTDIDNADLGVRHEEVIMDIQRSLNMLDQIFVDIAILVETQGENLDSIEDRVASVVNNANQMKRKNTNTEWLCWVLVVMLLTVFLYWGRNLEGVV
ncbi:Syntaxin-112 [Glycine soja]|nr:Syntaxin-112 [Glycine max]KHN29058.1 Syntaxin-112 [Glycine soja]